MESIAQARGRQQIAFSTFLPTVGGNYDVGGFAQSPPPDLVTRWIEVGAFTPMFRVHNDSETMPKEPWVHGPVHEAIRRRYIEARYRLLPYIYTLAEEASRTGVPLMRPFWLDHPDATAFTTNDHVVQPRVWPPVMCAAIAMGPTRTVSPSCTR